MSGAAGFPAVPTRRRPQVFTVCYHQRMLDGLHVQPRGNRRPVGRSVVFPSPVKGRPPLWIPIPLAVRHGSPAL